ncbi:helix-turn-helix domain-containing protein [Sinorhizobium terangae]|uniref:helix-turn-helix domain-containing protein n=1 Tax=Sinorhizobium terangae TaxID=110322 RepID=UPI0024B1352D|nr:helix-turn-helix domain-containing protein [Sinorhizobium terangae]WFU49169.1 helix-turn-helix domain-containing protein [Sinorhizobium terangae]
MAKSMINIGASVTDRDDLGIGDAVRRAREAVGYSVDDLAVTCGLTGAEITRIEIGADVDPDKLRRIAAALRVPTSAFLPN